MYILTTTTIVLKEKMRVAKKSFPPFLYFNSNSIVRFNRFLNSMNFPKHPTWVIVHCSWPFAWKFSLAFHDDFLVFKVVLLEKCVKTLRNGHETLGKQLYIRSGTVYGRSRWMPRKVRTRTQLRSGMNSEYLWRYFRIHLSNWKINCIILLVLFRDSLKKKISTVHRFSKRF